MNSTTRNKIIVAAVIIIALALTIFFRSNQSPTDTAVDTNNATTTPADMSTTTSTISTSTSSATSYSLAEVAKHNSQSSCWTTINGGVYDVTTWIGSHPGGSQAILSLCGKDGSQAFNDQHGEQQRVLSVLAGFKIGLLVK